MVKFLNFGTDGYEGKTMNARIKFALVIVSILLLASLTANGYLYFSVNDNLQRQVVEFQNQVTTLESQTVTLQRQVDTLQNNSGIDNQTISNFNAQILDLQTQIENMQKENDNLKSQISHLQNQPSPEIRVANLVTALGATFTWSYSATASYGMLHYLYVQGTVTNTGNGTAYNCDLKVIMTTSTGESFTEYYRFNALAPGEVENVDTHFYHDNLQSWTITPECTNTP